MPFNDKPHLFAIMNDECPHGQCLVLMITTVHAGKHYDPTCILKVGDHPFVEHDSYILYRKAERPRAQHMRSMLTKGYFRAKEDFDEPLFDRIFSGIFSSDETPLAIEKYARSTLAV